MRARGNPVWLLRQENFLFCCVSFGYMETTTKIVSREEAIAWRQSMGQQGKKVVMANGCFDLLHGGHISYLQDSRERGDVLLVAMNSDSSMRGLKGPSRPIMTQQERSALVEAVRVVDRVVIFDEPSVDDLLREIRPDVHAKGTDYSAESVPERETALSLGIEIAICGPPKENASRGIIATVIERYGKPAAN